MTCTTCVLWGARSAHCGRELLYKNTVTVKRFDPRRLAFVGAFGRSRKGPGRVCRKLVRRRRVDGIMEQRRWPRCGSGARPDDTHVTVESLRRGLAQAENPSGVLRGRMRHAPPAAPPRPAAASHAASGVISISGAPLELLQPAQPALRPAPRPRPAPPTHTDRLRAGRANAVEKFRGNSDGEAHEQAPAEWCCAICLRTDWHKRGLSRLPRCQHVFHTLCVDKWFERASVCPYCRVPV